MTTEEKARAYAEKAYYPAPEYGWYESDHEAMVDVLEQAYLAGAAEALASQWVSVEEVEPPIGKLILCRNLVDATLAYYDGEDICEAHDNSIIVRMPFWMSIPIPPLKGDPDTFNETDK